MCTSQTVDEEIGYLKDGHKISRPDSDSHLEMVTLKDGAKVILIVSEDADEPAGIWEPTQEEVLATDYIVE